MHHCWAQWEIQCPSSAVFKIKSSTLRRISKKYWSWGRSILGTLFPKLRAITVGKKWTLVLVIAREQLCSCTRPLAFTVLGPAMAPFSHPLQFSTCEPSVSLRSNTDRCNTLGCKWPPGSNPAPIVGRHRR